MVKGRHNKWRRHEEKNRIQKFKYLCYNILSYKEKNIMLPTCICICTETYRQVSKENMAIPKIMKQFPINYLNGIFVCHY